MKIGSYVEKYILLKVWQEFYLKIDVVLPKIIWFQVHVKQGEVGHSQEKWDTS